MGRSLFILSILTIIFSTSYSQAQTLAEYKSKVFNVTRNPTDLNTQVRAKNSLAKVQGVLRQMSSAIKQGARPFPDVEPIHIAAAIAGEHAINVGAADSVQNARLHLAHWLNKYVSADITVFDLIKQGKYQGCNSMNNYDFWYCVATIWDGKTGASNSSFRKFLHEYFNPNGVGKTFGVGQMSPVRAMMMDDMMKQYQPSLTLNFRKDGDIARVYDSILDYEKVVYFIGASIQFSINIYRRTARFDISKNPEITSTLYNIGNEKNNAYELYSKNVALIKKGQPIISPAPNSLGVWVLKNLDGIQAAIR